LKIAKQAAFILLWLFSSLAVNAQIENHAVPIIADSGNDSVVRVPVSPKNYHGQLDIKDVVGSEWQRIHKGGKKPVDTGEVNESKLRISAVPAAGYSLVTSFAALLAANASFKTDTGANTCTMVTSFTYTANKQIILPLNTSIWSKNNKYNIVTDWRYLNYPSYTYGLGGFTKLSDGYMIDYSTVHFHQAVLREVIPDMYAGVGYNLDYFWNIKELNPPPNTVTPFENYGYAATEFASGFTFNFLYDTRKNPINADGGNFVNVVYRPNLTIFGNTATWRSLIVDLRKYVKFPAGSNNVLAFWSYEWLTLSGKAPYLMLPNTGGDPYSNTGRGYIQGRYRSNNMAYVESEYRFGLTHNGFLGGVVFGNAQSFTEITNNKFETIAPGYGAGIRLKLDKFNRTNVAIDYGFGIGGSGGVFVNIGEVF